MDLANKFDRKRRMAGVAGPQHSAGVGPDVAICEREIGGGFVRIGRNITFLMVAVLLFAAPVLAQLLPVTVNVNVPFEFTVGNKNYPAGQYQIRRIATYAFVLRDRNQHALTTFPAVPVEENTARVTPVLRFQGENGRQVLTEVWPANGRYGFQFFPPKPTVALARVQDNSMKAQVETEVKASAPAR